MVIGNVLSNVKTLVDYDNVFTGLPLIHLKILHITWRDNSIEYPTPIYPVA